MYYFLFRRSILNQSIYQIELILLILVLGNTILMGMILYSLLYYLFMIVYTCTFNKPFAHVTLVGAFFGHYSMCLLPQTLLKSSQQFPINVVCPGLCYNSCLFSRVNGIMPFPFLSFAFIDHHNVYILPNCPFLLMI